MKKKGNRVANRLTVIFLRFFSGMNQVQFGAASRIDQGNLSRYETTGVVPEKNLRRMARAAKVTWPLAVHLRRFIEAFLAAARSRRSVADVGPLDPGILQPALLAVTPYLIEESVAKPGRQAPDEALREAEEIWTRLQRHPLDRRRHLIGLSLRAAQSWALALCIGEASGRAAAAGEKEAAVELAALALSIAERAPGPVKDSVQGFCLALLAYARQAAGDLAGAGATLARARDLLPPGAEREPLQDWPPPDFEAFLAAGRQAVVRGAGG